MARQKILSFKPTPTLELHFQNSQRIAAASHDDSGLVGLQNLPGDPGESSNLRLPDFQ